MPTWFEKAGNARKSIAVTQNKQIASIYRNMFFEVRNILGFSAPRLGWLVPNVIKKVYYESLERAIGDAVNNSVSQLEPLIKKNMMDASESVMQDNEEFLYDIGFEEDIVGEFEETKEDKERRIISMITSGELYDKKWTLSGFTKEEKKKIMADVHLIISKCIEKEMSSDDIIKNIELYFNPDRDKKVKFYRMFPGIKRKVDADSKRTGNTMVSHAYEETFVNVTMQNPFIEAYKWVTSGSDRVCPVCLDREGTDKFGLGIGIFPKDQLPLDHPNGMCTFDPVYVMSTGEIVREVGAWKNGTGSMKDSIDKWIKSFKK